MPDAASRPVRVLVADDQTPFRKAAAAVLGHLQDFELIGEARSGEEAVSVVATSEPDLVLMDVHMVGIDGFEATRRIVSAHPATVVILVSSYRTEDVEAAAAEAGALAFLPKDQFGARSLSELWSSRAARPAPPGTREPPSPGD
jgi:two-component system, NarL family, invasion response regulator UvrY